MAAQSGPALGAVVGECSQSQGALPGDLLHGGPYPAGQAQGDGGSASTQSQVDPTARTPSVMGALAHVVHEGFDAVSVALVLASHVNDLLGREALTSTGIPRSYRLCLREHLGPELGWQVAGSR